MTEIDLHLNATPKPRPGLAIPALLAANIALACGPWLVRLARTESQIGPVASAFWRVTLALPVLMIVAGGRARTVPRSGWPVAAAILSGLLFAADLGAWHVGILHTRLANATLLGNVTAILFPAYGFFIARRWPSRRQGMALALAAAGALLLLGRSYTLSSRDIAGDLFCISAGLAYTAYLVAIERARATIAPPLVLSLSAVAAMPGLLIAALALGEPVWPHDWAPLILMALGSQIVGQGLILYAVNRVAPLVVGLMLLVQPVVAAAIGWGVYGERLTAFDLAGATAIALAVLLVRETPPLKTPR